MFLEDKDQLKYLLSMWLPSLHIIREGMLTFVTTSFLCFLHNLYQQHCVSPYYITSYVHLWLITKQRVQCWKFEPTPFTKSSQASEFRVLYAHLHLITGLSVWPVGSCTQYCSLYLSINCSWNLNYIFYMLTLTYHHHRRQNLIR